MANVRREIFGRALIDKARVIKDDTGYVLNISPELNETQAIIDATYKNAWLDEFVCKHAHFHKSDDDAEIQTEQYDIFDMDDLLGIDEQVKENESLLGVKDTQPIKKFIDFEEDEWTVGYAFKKK